MKMMTTNAINAIHKFEAAGLGKAPFRFVGMETARDREMEQMHRAANGMVFTTNYATGCDYCGQGIYDAFMVESSDGKRFKVGCECINKTGDAGLKRFVMDEKNAKRRKAAAAKRVTKIEREKDLLSAFQAGRCESLRGLPHPKGRDGSAWDYVNWCIQNKFIGATVLKMIEDSI